MILAEATLEHGHVTVLCTHLEFRQIKHRDMISINTLTFHNFVWAFSLTCNHVLIQIQFPKQQEVHEYLSTSIESRRSNQVSCYERKWKAKSLETWPSFVGTLIFILIRPLICSSAVIIILAGIINNNIFERKVNFILRKQKCFIFKCQLNFCLYHIYILKHLLVCV